MTTPNQSEDSPDHISWLFEYAKKHHDEMLAKVGQPFDFDGVKGTYRHPDQDTETVRITRSYPDGTQESVVIKYERT
jgi:hypothetical protein